MPTDTERREAAESLKHYAHDQLQGGLLNTLKVATGIDGTWRDVLLRLTDLIDPGEPKMKPVIEVRVKIDDLNDAVNQAFADFTGIDRDALLELADEIDANGDRLLEDPSLLVGATGLMRCYADGIREALGVDDG